MQCPTGTIKFSDFLGLLSSSHLQLLGNSENELRHDKCLQSQRQAIVQFDCRLFSDVTNV